MPRRPLNLSLLLLAVGAGLLLAGAGRPSVSGSPAESRSGGTFRISFFAEFFDHVDPALSYATAGWSLLDATCAKLMNYPDKAPPDGLRVVPEVAASYPRLSTDGRTYTFNLRAGFRFSDGRPVGADAFARAISRTLARAIKSPGAQYTRDIVGANAVLAGRRTTPSGVVASRNRLVVKLTRPVPDFPARMTMPFFCAVPPSLPTDPEGVGAFPGSGPYFGRSRRSSL